MQFFVLRVASNKEDRVRDALRGRLRSRPSKASVGRILVPTERVPLDEGRRAQGIDRKLYPGYVFIELELDKNGMIPEKVWFMIKETDGVGDFIGSNGKPTAMSPKDQAKMLEEAERPKAKARPSRPHTRRAIASRSPTALHQLRGRSR